MPSCNMHLSYGRGLYTPELATLARDLPDSEVLSTTVGVVTWPDAEATYVCSPASSAVPTDKADLLELHSRLAFVREQVTLRDNRARLLASADGADVYILVSRKHGKETTLLLANAYVERDDDMQGDGATDVHLMLKHESA